MEKCPSAQSSTVVDLLEIRKKKLSSYFHDYSLETFLLIFPLLGIIAFRLQRS